MKFSLSAVLSPIFFIALNAHSETIFHCKDKQGKVIFQDYPCEKESSSTVAELPTIRSKTVDEKLANPKTILGPNLEKALLQINCNAIKPALKSAYDEQSNALRSGDIKRMKNAQANIDRLAKMNTDNGC